MIEMDDLGPAGSVKVTPGAGRAPGPGGGGSGGGGGAGEGTGPPKPVSIASIKRRAMPIGDTDFTRIGDYPVEARQKRIEGDVIVELIVDERGRVIRRRVVKGLGHGLDQRALAMARKLRFEPAIDANDRPVTSKVPWTFTFTLP
jgi:protein TonB